MPRRLVLLFASAALMVAASVVGHGYLRSIPTQGHLDHFAIAESHEHEASESGSAVPEAAVPIAVGPTALFFAAGSGRRLPIAALVTPTFVIAAQEAAEHGSAFGALVPSPSFLLVVAIALTAGAVLALLSKRLVRVAVAVLRRLRASTTFQQGPVPGDVWSRQIAFALGAVRAPPGAFTLDAPRAPPTPTCSYRI